ncbi:MAG: hypothetical protein ACN6N0_02965 [Microvirgula sp.]
MTGPLAASGFFAGFAEALIPKDNRVSAALPVSPCHGKQVCEAIGLPMAGKAGDSVFFPDISIIAGAGGDFKARIIAMGKGILPSGPYVFNLPE